MTARDLIRLLAKICNTYNKDLPIKIIAVTNKGEKFTKSFSVTDISETGHREGEIYILINPKGD